MTVEYSQSLYSIVWLGLSVHIVRCFLGAVTAPARKPVKMKRYCVDDFLVHEASGVCQVKAIIRQDLMGTGTEREYYDLNPVFENRSHVITPVESNRQRVRSVSSQRTMKEIFSRLADLELIEIKGDRQRAEYYRQILLNQDPMEMARLIKTIYYRNHMRIAQGKKTMSQDERTMSAAKKKFFDEMAFILKDSQEALEIKFCEILDRDDPSRELMDKRKTRKRRI